VIATYQMAGDVGSLTGPLLAGALADSVGYDAAFGATAAVLFGAALTAVRAPETLERDPAAMR
jgi:MFS transporter, DHA1 family, multidrug resistance protein